MSTDGFFFSKEALNTPDFFNTYTIACTQQIQMNEWINEGELESYLSFSKFRTTKREVNFYHTYQN